MPDSGAQKSPARQGRRRGAIIHACLLGGVALVIYVGFYFLVGSR